jgi:FtsP/CotA-like multicopper oxidase with cupredoxin domain
MSKNLLFLLWPSLCVVLWRAELRAQDASQPCPRPAPGAAVIEPQDLRSHDGVLKVELTARNARPSDGATRYCYVDANGDESPTLRANPGDLVILSLKNNLTNFDSAAASIHQHSRGESEPCGKGLMTRESANLHFHGLTIPPACHQDDVLKTAIQPGDPPFEYRFRIPENEPPGLYWYHPHIHGFTKEQVLGGASGAIIIEGIERADSAVAGLPERVFIIRDQDLLNPSAPPAKSEPVVSKMMLDHDGDAANTGMGYGRPAKDLSINFVPVPYPDYQPAVIHMKPEEQQLWRLVNASALTYLDLELLFGGTAQQLGLVAMDGVPLNYSGLAADFVDWQTHLAVPPGGRVEFIVKGPVAGAPALLVTRTVDTGPSGENDPNRSLAMITVSPIEDKPIKDKKEDVPEVDVLPASPKPLPPSQVPWLGSVAPVRTRRLYFSEKILNPRDPNSPVQFYLTIDGKKPAPFDPHAGLPNIIAKQGTVEDWIIENRSSELHAFHIHQTHFMLIDHGGKPANEPFLRDTVNVPYYNGRGLAYPSVRLRMDFRDPNTIGDFPYHCHLLEHEDGGMMGTIRIEP